MVDEAYSGYQAPNLQSYISFLQTYFWHKLLAFWSVKLIQQFLVNKYLNILWLMLKKMQFDSVFFWVMIPRIIPPSSSKNIKHKSNYYWNYRIILDSNIIWEAVCTSIKMVPSYRTVGVEYMTCLDIFQRNIQSKHYNSQILIQN